jgi:alpha-beta hydrolase superfamily lysophospholipase
MIARHDAERPFFFGADQGLFGIYHPPVVPATQAALLCPPLGQDHIRSHRLYRQLATVLAAAGMPALRFDFFGSGDSAGDSADIRWDRCLADTTAAAAELRQLSGCDRIAVFGARLGGSIAVAAAASVDPSRIVAWDPVLDGADYVARLDALQESLRIDTRRFNEPRAAEAAAGQWQGFTIDARLRQQLAELRLEPPSTQVHLIESALPATTTPSRQRFIAHGATVTPLSSSTPWEELERLEMAIISHELVQSASGLLREAT